MRTINKEEITGRLGHVVVLKGGDSVEREISLISGDAVTRGLTRLGVNVTAIDVGDDIIGKLTAAKPDLVLIMLHGKGGEDGVIQGLLEVMKIPYSGSGVLASALAMDKVRTKMLWQQVGLGTARHSELNAESDWHSIIDDLGKVVVKPVSGGSSLGVFMASDAAQLESLYREAAAYDSQVMAEQFIEGREYSRGVLGDWLLPTIEIRTPKAFFDFDAKYTDSSTEIIVQPEFSEVDSQRVDEVTRKAYDILGCKGLARVDFMQGADGQFYLLELNTIPGMTEHSFVPAAAKGIGIDFDGLLLYILEEELRQAGI